MKNCNLYWVYSCLFVMGALSFLLPFHRLLLGLFIHSRCCTQTSPIPKE